MRTLLLVVLVLTNASAQTTAPIIDVIQAEHCSAHQGGSLSKEYLDPAVGIRNLGNGDWVRFDSVNFFDGQYDSLAFHYCYDWTNAGPTAAVRFRLDSPTAAPIASIVSWHGGHTWNTPGPNDVEMAVLPRLTGYHALYITIEGIDDWLAIDKIELSGHVTVTAADAKTYYVAQYGNDASDGLSLDSPYRTIQKAASVMRPGSTCKIRQGIYRETVKLVCSGLPGAPLTFEAYNGEYAVISGADPITGWTAHSGSIYKAPMRVSIGTYNDQILVDGKMAWVARTPNVNEPYSPVSDLEWCAAGIYDWRLLQTTADPIAYPTRVCLNGGGWTDDSHSSYSMELNNWYAVPSQGLLHRPSNYFAGGLLTVHHGWVNTGLITSSRSYTDAEPVSGFTTSRTSVIATPTGGFTSNGQGPGWISHLFSLLDSPNEWFRRDSTLYLWVPDGADPSHHLVEAKRRLLGFELQSRQYVNVTGLRFIATSLNTEDASNCTIDRCEFRYVSHFDTVPWWDVGHTWSAPFDPSDGHAGLNLAGRNNTISNSLVSVSAGPGIVVSGWNDRVTNCHVTECNYALTGFGGININKRTWQDPDQGRGIRIDHNSLRANGRANVQIEAASTPENNEDRLRIEYNDFGASQYLSSEQGSLGARAAKSVEVSHNWFHGVAGWDAGDIVMESDWGALHWIVHHNVFWQGRFDKGECAVGAGRLRGYSWTFDWGDTGTSAQLPNVGGALCFNNTVVDVSEELHRDWEMAWPGYKRNNIMAQSDTAPWMFSNPDIHDYTLRAGSPAIDKGIVIPGWETPYTGSAPDLGAYESGQPRWVAGADWQPAPWTWYPPAEIPTGAVLPGIMAPNALRPELIRLPRGIRIAVNGRGAYRVRVFDMKGALVLLRTVDRGGTTFIPTTETANGIYVVRVSSADLQRSWKVLVGR